MKQKRVLGIDPGSSITGYGIVEENNNKLSLVTCGVIRTDAKSSFVHRLKCIYTGTVSIIEQYRPSSVAVEALFFAKNVGSAIKLGQARGAIITAIANYNLDVFEYSSTKVKEAIVGYGHSGKDQIQRMVFLLLGIKFSEKPILLDASDALAIAICHIYSYGRVKL